MIITDNQTQPTLRVSTPAAPANGGRSIEALTVMGMLHDMRNLLARIEGSAALVGPLVEQQNAPLPEVWQVHQRAVERLSELTRTLFSVTSHGLEQPAPADLSTVVAEVCALCKDSYAGSRVRLSWSVQQGCPPVPMRVEGITRALYMLVSNAMEACCNFGGGNVSVRVKADPLRRSAVIQVRDDGPGIAPGSQRTIFTAGFSTKGSSGMGLPMAQRLIAEHNGTLELESRDGQTCFTVSLPLAAMPVSDDSEPEAMRA